MVKKKKVDSKEIGKIIWSIIGIVISFIGAIIVYPLFRDIFGTGVGIGGGIFLFFVLFGFWDLMGKAFRIIERESKKSS